MALWGKGKNEKKKKPKNWETRGKYFLKNFKKNKNLGKKNRTKNV